MQFLKQRTLVPLFSILVIALLTIMTSVAGAQADRNEFEAEFDIRTIEIQEVKFEEPQRIGYGESAEFYSSAIEIRAIVPAFEPGSLAPIMTVGDVSLTDSRAVYEADQITLAFYAYETDKLVENACISISYGNNNPRDCQFRYSGRSIRVGTPLEISQPGPTGLRIASQPDRVEPVKPEPEIVYTVDDYRNVKVNLLDSHGNSAETIPVGSSLSLALTGLPSSAPIRIQLLDDTGQEWSFAQLTSDEKGNIPSSVFWYHTGVIGTTSRDMSWQPKTGFTTFEEASRYFSGRELSIELSTLEGEVFSKVPVRISAESKAPMFYPSNSRGVLMNAFEAGNDRIYVTGTNFPAGSNIQLFVVRDQYQWQEGDTLNDVTERIENIRLSPGQTTFTVEVWPTDSVELGTYDIAAKIVENFSAEPEKFTYTKGDIVSYGDDYALLTYEIVNGHIVNDIAGRPNVAPAWFEFVDVFERGEDVWAAVDPSHVPPMHTGGNYAEIAVVDHQLAAYWDGTAPAVTDVTGSTEIRRVKYPILAPTRTKVWDSANPPSGDSEFDVIVDFGSVPAEFSWQFTSDGTYTKGTDFIDSYSDVEDSVGFYIIDDPSTPGTFPVGSFDFLDEGTTGDNPAFDLTSAGFPFVRNWFTIRYPAVSTGADTALPSGTDRFPVVLFLHGRHRTCAASQFGFFDDPCDPADRVESHQGYNYILDVLASRGYIAISVDAYDIQPSNGSTNYEARGLLILEHLNRLENWDANGTAPTTNADFEDRIDMSNIAIVGHSRGGEGVVAADEINLGNPGTYGHDLKAVIAIAPTDQQSGGSWNLQTAPYLLINGAADGDVSNHQGYRTYDRAYPDGAAAQDVKSAGLLYGANHNFFNTEWTPGLSITDPFASDDGSSWTGPRMSAGDQRQAALANIVGFVEWHLGGVSPFREMFTGQLEIDSVENTSIHWSFQDPDRQHIDNFEDGNGFGTNSLGENVTTTPALDTEVEGGAGAPSCSFHATNGSRMEWSTPFSLYETEIPTANQDMSAYDFVTFRVLQTDDAINAVAGKNILVTLFDTDGDSYMLNTLNFTTIPYPYQRLSSSSVCLMKNVRLPLDGFSINESGVDIDKLDKIQLTLLDNGFIIIDDIQFTK